MLNEVVSPFQRIKAIGIAGTLLVCLANGCRKADQANNFDSAVSYEAALKSLESGDFKASVEQLTRAIDAGGLDPDQYATAMIRRAECYARVGDLAAAHTDLDNAEIGAPDLDQVYVVRSFVFGKEGKMNESAEAMKMAKKENSAAQPLAE